MFKTNRLAPALAVAGALGALGAAQATTINNGLTPGVFNLVQDESREAYVDVNGDGKFGVGDVIFGFIQINNFSPSGALANNAVYGVFSQQVTSVAGSSITFGATTVAGLTLSALTGAPAIAGAVASFYDNPLAGGYSTNLITTALGSATSMKDYINFITGNGTLRLTAGLSRPSDFLVSGSSFAGVSNSAFIGLPSNVTVASTGGGMTVVLNNTSFAYASTVTSSSPPGYVPLVLDTTAQLGISAGTVSGSGGATPIPQNWLNASYGGYTFQQCTSTAGINTACGFIDKNDFGVAPVAVPEPGSLILVSGALLGLAGVGRRRKDKHSS
jgi:hypothetical protein